MPIIDLHCDTMYRLYEESKKSLAQNDLHIDLEKMKAGKAVGQFFALFVDAKDVLNKGRHPLEHCLGMLDHFYNEIEKNHLDIERATNYNEMVENKRNGKLSAFLAIEEGGVIGKDLHHLRNFYRLGVRLITLTWDYPNSLGYPNCKEDYRAAGLTSFGKDVIWEMNNLGMLIDVSHLSDGGFYDVAKLSRAPFIASHSNARTIKNHPRNLTDDMIKILANKGGIMGLNFASYFLGDRDMSRVEDMVLHLKHIRKIGGIDVISLGSDFDGISCKLEIQNMGEMDKLIHALKGSGFTEGEIEKITHINAERVIKEVL